MSGKNQVAFVKPEEPSFLKQFKKRAGYKEGPTVSDKKREMKLDSDNLQDRVDEQPLIVTLKPGDLTEEEVKAIQGEKIPEITEDQTEDFIDLQKKSTAIMPDFEYASEVATEGGSGDKKVVFRKPTKRPAQQDGRNSLGNSAAVKDSKKPKQESPMEKVKNRNLLSFEEDEAE